jgi:hypothetical protein
VLSKASGTPGRAHRFQARVENPTQAAALIAQHPGYQVRQQVLGAAAILLTFVRV